MAKGTVTPDGFAVFASSRAAPTEVPSCPAYIKELRAQLVANGVLKAAGEGYVFTQDYSFASPSMAAGVVLARSPNGRVEWKTSEGRTLKELQQAEAEA